MAGQIKSLTHFYILALHFMGLCYFVSYRLFNRKSEDNIRGLNETEDLVRRFKLIIECSIFPALMLFVGVIKIALHRLSGVDRDPIIPLLKSANQTNPSGEPKEHSGQSSQSGQVLTAENYRPMLVDQRYLQNTLEQLILHLVTQAGLAVRLPEAYLFIVPANSFIFVVARLVFWFGYHVDSTWRRPGFRMTIVPNGVSFIYLAISVAISIFQNILV